MADIFKEPLEGYSRVKRVANEMHPQQPLERMSIDQCDTLMGGRSLLVRLYP